MRPVVCTVARRVSKHCPQRTNVDAMSKDIYPIRRAQLIHHPRASKPLGLITLLPTEVLTNIFLYSVSGKSEASASNPPLVLAQVCSSWRRVALGIPQLWENLNLNLSIKPTLPPSSPFARPPTLSAPLKTPRALASLASLWFERARNQLLSVSIKLTTSSTNATHDVSSSFAGPILSNARAIRHLSISVTSSSLLQRFFTSECPGFINLESLSLSIQHFDSPSLPITVFGDSPQLSRVSFDFNGFPPSPSLIRLPWSRLERFDMTGASILPVDEFHTLLSTCGNLREAAVWVEDAVDEVRVTDEVAIITLPHLTKLSVSFYGRDEKTADSLLNPFDLPHLRHFHFFSGFITLPFMPTVNSHQLETLVLSGVNVSSEAFLAFAVAHSSLHSLTLDLRYFDGGSIFSVLGILAAGRLSPRVLPHLTRLSLWTRDISSYSAAFSRMVCARGRYGSSRGDLLRLVLYLARQQHGACCYFSTCNKSSSGGPTQLDDILALADLCESTEGVEFYVSDVKPDEGICEVAE